MRVRARQLLVLLSDLLVGAISIAVGAAIRFGAPAWTDPFGHLQKFTGATFLAFVIPPVVFYLAELYSPRADFKRLKWITRLVGAFAVALLIEIAFYYWFPWWKMWRGALAYQALVYLPAIVASRVLITMARRRAAPHTRVLVVGLGARARELGSLLGDAARAEMSLVGFVSRSVDGESQVGDMGPTFGSCDELTEIADREGVRLIVHTGIAHDDPCLRHVVDAKLKGFDVVDDTTVFKRLTGRIPVHQIDDIWLLEQGGFGLLKNPLMQRLQRLLDVVSAVVLIVLCAPLMLLAALVVLVTMGRPVIFSQRRVGKNEGLFRILKFRTMRRDAEEGTGPVWSSGADDQRVTRLGRVLRRTRVDELPQLWNVLKGDMSFIGPRPERPHFVEQLKREIPYYSLRFLVKPGLSGWAQVMYRYSASVAGAREKLCYDLYYIQENSLALNLQILLRTVQTVLFHKGS